MLLSVSYRSRHRSMLQIYFFNNTASTEIYTLSLHDALPISPKRDPSLRARCKSSAELTMQSRPLTESRRLARSEEHTSELQSRQYLVCRLLLEKKKDSTPIDIPSPKVISFSELFTSRRWGRA